MISFLNVDDIGLRGLRFPFSHVELREAEFAYGIALYLQGDLDNLQKVEMALTTLCKASGALANWNKSLAFWTLGINILHMGSTSTISVDTMRYPSLVPKRSLGQFGKIVCSEYKGKKASVED